MAEKQIKENVLEQKNKELEAKIAEMEKMMQSLISQQNQKTENIPNTLPAILEDINEYDIQEIPLNKVIKVMSLYSGGLNLKTSDSAESQVVRFEYIGQILPILYVDLVKIIANQRSFFEDGYCLILDKNVVKVHYLEQYYKKFIDGKVINNILDYEIDKIQEIFTNTAKVIQQSIVDLIIQKINKNDYVDKNKITAISDVYGFDIYELALKMR